MVAQLGTEAGSDAGWKLHVPYFASGRVVRGFGRGGKQLHCPTANLDEQCVSALPTTFPCGVYYGWAKVDTTDVYPMVMSIGYNPQFKNTVKTMEVHILHEFEDDFYDRQLSIIILGRIRSMTVFSSLDELILAIESDKRLALAAVSEHAASMYRTHAYFST